MAVGENGMICTSHPAASMAGLDMLRSGGNAVDAALAAIAVLAVVEPHMTGIGGDCFALFSMGGAAPIALDGSGRAPGAAKAEWYVDRDIREIPPTSAHAVTIPGAISAWCTLNRDHGSKPLSEVLAPAIRLAEEGMRVTPRVAWDWGRQIEKLSGDPDYPRRISARRSRARCRRNFRNRRSPKPCVASAARARPDSTPARSPRP